MDKENLVFKKIADAVEVEVASNGLFPNFKFYKESLIRDEPRFPCIAINRARPDIVDCFFGGGAIMSQAIVVCVYFKELSHEAVTVNTITDKYYLESLASLYADRLRQFYVNLAIAWATNNTINAHVLEQTIDNEPIGDDGVFGIKMTIKIEYEQE